MIVFIIIKIIKIKADEIFVNLDKKYL
jgi:hypothetical protein